MWATCTKYGSAPSERSALTPSIFGASAAMARRSRGNRRVGGVEAVEELPHRRERRRIVAGRLGMADPDADEQPLREVGRELGVFGGELGRLVGPDVDDARPDDELRRRVEQRAHARQARRAAEPERRRSRAPRRASPPPRTARRRVRGGSTQTPILPRSIAGSLPPADRPGRLGVSRRRAGAAAGRAAASSGARRAAAPPGRA